MGCFDKSARTLILRAVLTVLLVSAAGPAIAAKDKKDTGKLESVIESLVDDSTAPTPEAGAAPEPAAPSPAAARKADADRGLLDSLVDAAEPEDDTRE